MATKFGIVPTEVRVQRTSDGCAPAFVRAVEATLRELEGGLPELPFEWMRTDERQRFLFGFGRDYDDGRGRVTKARTAEFTWHRYGLAVDVVEKDATPWNAPMSFWEELGEAGERNGLDWGGRWPSPDWPHLQWGRCPASPTAEDIALYATRGIVAVWEKYGAAA